MTPAGRLAGFTTIAAETATVYARAPVAPTLSVAVIVKFELPATVGVPVMAPVVAFSDSPAGKPPATAKVDAPVPPAVLTVWLYAAPTEPPGRLAGLTVTAGFTMTE